MLLGTKMEQQEKKAWKPGLWYPKKQLLHLPASRRRAPRKQAAFI